VIERLGVLPLFWKVPQVDLLLEVFAGALNEMNYQKREEEELPKSRNFRRPVDIAS
jgi:hypothetical protein